MGSATLTYEQAIDQLMQQLPMFSRIGSAAYKKDIGNTLALCAALGDPHTKFRAVHIAGTNGKGSVSHMLAAALQQAGYTTGLYTSPHLVDFRERIRVNGSMIEKDFVVDFLERIQGSTAAINPSFFEITVAMAFDYFSWKKVDIAVIETGLGGRFDSTNVIMPVLSIITNISYDHQHLLGNTLPEIAGEKAGIIKPGVPVVIGEKQEATDAVFLQAAARNNAPIIWAEEQWEVTGSAQNDHQEITVEEKATGKRYRYSLDLTGLYQQKNSCTFLSAVQILQRQGWSITAAHLQHALRNIRSLTGLRGRWDIIAHHPLVVVDVAHNEAGLREVFRQAALQPVAQLHIVTGFVSDKEVAKVLRLFPRDARCYFCNAAIPRALPAGELQQLARNAGLEGEAYATVNAAFTAAKQHAGPQDMILVCGSFFIAGEVMTTLEDEG